MIEQHDLKHVWIAMSALAGSITALANMKYKEMSWTDIMLTVFVGFAFAVIFVPYAASDWIGIDENNLRGICASVYIGGTAWNSLMPLVIRRFKKMLEAIGGEDKA